MTNLLKVSFKSRLLYCLPFLLAVPLLASATEIQVVVQDLKGSQPAFPLATQTGKFENDNTFVKLYPDVVGPRVANKNVFVRLPQHLSYDDLMEALIKVRAAQTSGANQVFIDCQSLLSDVALIGGRGEYLDVESFFGIAGAQFVREDGRVREISIKKETRNTLNPDRGYLIGGSNHLELVEQLGAELKKRPVTFDELQSQAVTLRGRKVFWVLAAAVPVNDSIFKALAEIHWMVQQGAVVHLVSPYLPYARSDKPELQYGVTTQGRLVADLIENAGAQGITVVRAHAPQSMGFFKIHSSEVSSHATLVNYLKAKEIDCVVAPDAGSQKDATKFQLELKTVLNRDNIGLAVMNKQRDKDGNERILGGTGLEAIVGKNVVIIDDETASGGTLAKVAETIQAYQPKSVFAIVTHLAGPAEKSILSPFINRVVVTNTLPIQVRNEKLTVLSIAEELADEIRKALN